ncbi:Response regulator receiver domain-containing protein [Filimonas lacunae]|uniref:Response regulator receiver domain-containing protein n=1 Tax=Filimonas lacunae TaxID=477680 RepID=A0A173MPE8_9BACT|nr:response regulator [Filimonas lacunae]BAV09514.1 two-component response regulator [Filimonas lacunae]SIS74488.1 Response regulator receiver domain-containing protein [Filimonas lacunae]
MIRKILLADDDGDDRLIFTEVFDLLGDSKATLSVVENGLEVISFLESITEDGHLPNLIILDHNMPKMNGKQALEYLKNTHRYKNINVIIYSTYNDASFIGECEKLGAASIVVKPSSYDEYVAMVQDFLKLS